MIRAVDEEIMKAAGALLLKDVKEGFRTCEHMIVTGNERDMQYFLECCVLACGGNAYADFYYPVLNPEEQKGFYTELSEREKEVLEELETDAGEVYFPLTAGSLEFFSGITARNWLFSTFYFTGKQAVVWGNYDLKYPVFCKTTETLVYYKKIAEKCGLEITE